MARSRKSKRHTGQLYEQDMTDNASAVKFVDRYMQEMRYVYSWKKWLFWDGRRWNLKQGDNKVGDKSRLFASSIWSEVELAWENGDESADDYVKFAQTSNKKERIKAVIDLAAYDQRVAINHDQLDSDPYLFNALNGTYDLRSNTFREHQREDLVTQVANVKFDEAAECPLWLQMLEHIFNGDQLLIHYVQSLLGYSLSGITDEHILPICYGSGNNGKSTLWNTIAEIFGDYSVLVSQDLLMPSKDQHPTEIADLYGRRFVAVSEPEQNRSLAESRVKDMTGDQILKARRMREDFWEFVPTHTFWLSTNHKPKITGTDAGIWRRVKLIPFTVDLSDVVKVDKGFPDKLRAEYSGILNWCIAGWKSYQLHGLNEPKVVVDATAEYRSSEDVFGEFLRETYIENSGFMIGATEAFQSYQAWGGKMNKQAFSGEMTKRFEKAKGTVAPYRGKWLYRGIGLPE
ncbi:phage/plasmid primase, P4 family [Mariniblastus sp.]|nr:phage/plasmid primase, P4 family [Mariniblastus sp.]